MEDYEMDKKYKDDKYIEDNIDSETVFRTFREEIPKEELVEIVRVVAKQAIPRLDEEPIEPLKRASPDITGNLFDRVSFLRERVDETKKAMELRESIHNDIIADIDSDIEEKGRIENQLTNMDEKRNIKMDISILRREKRSENVRFWKDIFELRTELRELLENYQTETKIVKIFEDLGGEE
ncbi:MAG: hypothetical protein JSW41_06010 [Candidatus Aenigmatarchaeota archaeon]|nr:MAG: hypothetical protein JSW41_06010 [Candidatus Aenigmarchaeota archaeon]